MAVGVTQGEVIQQRRFQRLAVTETEHVANLELPSHQHATACVAWVLSGRFVEELDGVTYTCEVGTLLYKPGKASHRNRYGAVGARTLLIEIPDELSPAAGAACWTPARQGAELSRLLREFRSRWTCLDTASGPAGRGAEMMAEGALLQLLGALLRDASERPRAEPAPNWLRAARAIIAEDPASVGGLGDLADRVGVREERLGRAFRRHYGISYTDFIRERRVVYAANLVRESGASLLEIALRAGFADQSHMTREFRRCLGATPGALRR